MRIDLNKQNATIYYLPETHLVIYKPVTIKCMEKYTTQTTIQINWNGFN